jgi:hypothetical protein
MLVEVRFLLIFFTEGYVGELSNVGAALLQLLRFLKKIRKVKFFFHSLEY